MLWPALQNSFKLAFVAFIILVPISILGGVIAGLRYGRPTDKGITMFGLSVSAMPDFVTGIVLILVFARLARLAAGDGAGRARGEPARAGRSICSCLRSR